jgi:hypothetical protein
MQSCRLGQVGAERGFSPAVNGSVDSQLVLHGPRQDPVHEQLYLAVRAMDGVVDDDSANTISFAWRDHVKIMCMAAVFGDRSSNCSSDLISGAATQGGFVTSGSNRVPIHS